MLLGGLWHGANWTFVAWGGLHGVYLWVEKFFRDRKERVIAVVAAGGGSGAVMPARSGSGVVMPKAAAVEGNFAYALFTFFLVNITWVFFRASTFGKAGSMLASMFGFVHGAAPVLATLAMVKIGVILGVVVVIHWLLRNTTVLEAVYRMPWWLTGLLWSGMIVLLLLSQASSSSFIYFQF